LEVAVSRESLLAIIREHPEKDMARLQYADWLEEFGDCDRDTATVEFIRASCDFRDPSLLKMPDVAYGWLEHHWKRLVPSPLEVMKIDWFYRSGRVIHMSSAVVFPDGESTRCYSLRFEFRRGFLLKFHRWCCVGSSVILPRLKIDQPFAT
jgi:uncharacterized protein (TIGR02996 family)